MPVRLAGTMKGLSQEELGRAVVRLWAVWHVKHKAIYENELESTVSALLHRKIHLRARIVKNQTGYEPNRLNREAMINTSAGRDDKNQH